jgi:hypothetical protein
MGCRRQLETFPRNPAGNQARPGEPSQHLEARLARWRGNPPREAKLASFKAVRWSLESPNAGALAIPLAGAALPHRPGQGRAVLPGSKDRAPKHLGFPGNLGGPGFLQAFHSGSGDRLPNPRPAALRPGPPGAQPQARRLVAPGEGNRVRREGYRASHPLVVPSPQGNSTRRTVGRGRGVPVCGPGGGHQREHVVAPSPVTGTAPDSVRGGRRASAGVVSAARQSRRLTNRMP